MKRIASCSLSCSLLGPTPGLLPPRRAFRSPGTDPRARSLCQKGKCPLYPSAGRLPPGKGGNPAWRPRSPVACAPGTKRSELIELSFSVCVSGAHRIKKIGNRSSQKKKKSDQIREQEKKKKEENCALDILLSLVGVAYISGRATKVWELQHDNHLLCASQAYNSTKRRD